MSKMFKCKQCGEGFLQRDKGCKLVSKPFHLYPLCPRCVILDKEIHCNNCNKNFRLKEGDLDECWICQKKGCSFCLNGVKVKGVLFYFCDIHKKYDYDELVKDIEEVKEEKKMDWKDKLLKLWEERSEKQDKEGEDVVVDFEDLIIDVEVIIKDLIIDVKEKIKLEALPYDFREVENKKLSWEDIEKIFKENYV